LRPTAIVMKGRGAGQDVGIEEMGQSLARNVVMMIFVILSSISQKQIQLDAQMVLVAHADPGHEIMCGHVTIGGHVITGHEITGHVKTKIHEITGQDLENIHQDDPIFSAQHVGQ